MKPAQPTEETSKDSSQTSATTPETNQSANQESHESSLEWQRLELDKRRLQLDIDAHEASSKLDSERIALEKSKERTTKLQISLPILLSIIALAFSFYSEYRRSVIQHEQLEEQKEEQKEEKWIERNNYRGERLELFKRMAEHTTDKNELIKIYRELFYDDPGGF